MTKAADAGRGRKLGFLRTAAVSFVIATVHPAAASRTFEYLYIAANEGGSSGGHVAIRFEDRTYHFQRSDDALLQLYRDDSAAFEHRYAVLGNRAIRAHRILVDDDTYETLRERFNGRYLIESKSVRTLASLRADERLLEALARGANPAVAIPGAGYFRLPPADEKSSSRRAATAQPVETHDGAAVSGLRRRIERAYGPTYLQRRIDGVDAALADLDPVRAANGAEPNGALPFYGLSDRYSELLAARTALVVLRDAPPLREESLRRPGGTDFRLTAAQAIALRAIARHIADDVVALVSSPGTNWGYAVLVGAARVAAIGDSLAADSLVVLDTFAPDARVADARTLARRGARVHEALAEELLDEYSQAVLELQRAGAPGELHYAYVEEAANRFDEFAVAVRVKTGPRVSRSALRPQRPAFVRAPTPVRGADGIAMRAAYERARERRRAYAAALRSEYGYHLFERNCVSEIFRTINETMGVRPRSESTVRLGGFIDPDGSLNFVPFVSADAVLANYRVIETTETPSYRSVRMREMYARENDVLVYLREFNTLTSTVYARNLDDSTFFAFTDDVVLARPILGAANVVAGLGRTVLGLFRAPFDRGRALVDGLRGTMYSLPELAFVNIRKGSQYYVEPEDRRMVVERPVTEDSVFSPRRISLARRESSPPRR